MRGEFYEAPGCSISEVFSWTSWNQYCWILKGYRSQSFSDEELYQWFQEAIKRKREVDPWQHSRIGKDLQWGLFWVISDYIVWLQHLLRLQMCFQGGTMGSFWTYIFDFIGSVFVTSVSLQISEFCHLAQIPLGRCLSESESTDNRFCLNFTFIGHFHRLLARYTQMSCSPQNSRFYPLKTRKKSRFYTLKIRKFS